MRLVEERHKKNISQLQAAREAGISQSMLAMMEKGSRFGTDATKVKLAKFYGVSVEYLFFDSKITKRDNDVSGMN